MARRSIASVDVGLGLKVARPPVCAGEIAQSAPTHCHSPRQHRLNGRVQLLHPRRPDARGNRRWADTGQKKHF